jgi:hypothetical protein
MRLWSLHPRYLDVQGLLAVWREGLLAQKVLRGKTKGYRHHPQLLRFQAKENPVDFIGAFLSEVFREAERRGYAFDRRRIVRFIPKVSKRISVTRGQLKWESKHLMAKMRKRSPAFLKSLKPKGPFKPHPLFQVRPGGVEAWEKTTNRKHA